jgi:hypothetical protein
MTTPWTDEPEGRGGLGRNSWIGLGVLLVAALAFFAYSWLMPPAGAKLDPDVIVGEWLGEDPPWRLSFRPDRTAELTYDASVPETLAPTLNTPGVPVAGKYIRTEKGVYRLKLENGKVYEAAIGKYKIRKDDKFVDQYIENRLDLTDADGSSGVVVFRRIIE